jgi:hypothetical protein
MDKISNVFLSVDGFNVLTNTPTRFNNNSSSFNGSFRNIYAFENSLGPAEKKLISSDFDFYKLATP